jgi:hypothetical protein
MSEFPMSAEAWHTGLTLEAYVDSMERHQAASRRRLAQPALRPEDRAELARSAQARHALAMTEDWCGDSLLNVPILAQVVDAIPGMDLRIFRRALSPALDGYYQQRNITHIPVFTFLDAHFRPLATWVERPQAAHDRLAAWYAARPAIAALRADPSLDPEERRMQLRELTAGLLDEMESWYDQGLQQATVAEIRQLLRTEPTLA